MKRIWKILLSAVVTLVFSGCMFYCFVAGAPTGQDGFTLYVAAAAGFSLLLPSLVCAAIHYILYLQKKLSDYENKAEIPPCS